MSTNARGFYGITQATTLSRFIETQSHLQRRKPQTKSIATASRTTKTTKEQSESLLDTRQRKRAILPQTFRWNHHMVW